MSRRTVISSRNDYLLLPVNRAFIALSFVLATMLNLLPWGPLAGIPDFVALVVVFWNVHQPRRVGIGIGFVLGLILDVHNSSLLGERALLYSLLAYGAWSMHKRVPWFSIGGQVLHVLPLFVGAQALVVVVRLATGAPLPGVTLFLQWVSTALLWPVADLLLLAPQRRAAERDENRPL
ncbi:MAG: rod shape-determining protein MreD [Burkholderiaceae bacterium]|jgi:rod shape-determining protein MreD